MGFKIFSQTLYTETIYEFEIEEIKYIGGRCCKSGFLFLEWEVIEKHRGKTRMIHIIDKNWKHLYELAFNLLYVQMVICMYYTFIYTERIECTHMCSPFD